MKKLLVLVIIMMFVVPSSVKADGECPPAGDGWENLMGPQDWKEGELQASIDMVCIDGRIYTRENPEDACFGFSGFGTTTLMMHNYQCGFSVFRYHFGPLMQESTATSVSTETPTVTATSVSTETLTVTATFVSTTIPIAKQTSIPTSTVQIQQNVRPMVILTLVLILLIILVIGYLLNKRRKR